MQKNIASLERKIKAMRTMGVDVSTLEAMLAKAKAKSSKKRSATPARQAVENLQIAVSLVVKELDNVVSGLAGKSVEKKTDAPPSLDEIRTTVEDAFKKHLHSAALRRMVEVVALEKLQSILGGSDVPSAWLDQVVDEVQRRQKKRRRK